ncbi:MAG TPA: L-histidine N(alpha)-methyltransferase [Anaeromyxobacteraceae bacterium]|nr:L-histidine N(alpha)-methyltransferase [Anaeromyxobacteraceae bacterium]
MQPTTALDLTSAPAPEALERFRRDVVAGLSARPRSLPSVYFYDDEGSRLFQRIAELPEYYLTRTERAILERRAPEIAAPLAGRPVTVVDLGAGDGDKTRLLLAALRERTPRVAYAPVDVSAAALVEAGARVRAEWPGLEVVPVPADYAAGLRWLAGREAEGALLVLLLGSNVGNLEHPAAAALFAELRRALRPGDHALVGFDLVKEAAVLRAAYDDAAGVTAAFNLNLLHRMNRELGADFDPGAFAHRAAWVRRRARMESFLVSRRAQVVHVAGRAFELGRGERIQTEISCKYTPARAARFAREAGFEEAGRFTDERGWFLDALWRVPERA